MAEAVIGILVENEADLPLLTRAAGILDQFETPYELRQLSAHLSLQKVSDYAAGAQKRGIKVIIAAAHGAANLAGVVASRTTLPVIGVPLDTSPLGGLGSLLPTVQMPAGIPVAAMAIGAAGAKNACILAAQILALQDPTLQERIEQYRAAMATGVEAKGERLRDQGYRSYLREKKGRSRR